MKRLLSLFLAAVLVTAALSALTETAVPEFSKDYRRYVERYENAGSAEKKVALLRKGLEKIDGLYESYVFYSYLISEYAAESRYEDCADVIRSAHAEGLVMTFDTEHDWPAYVVDFKAHEELRGLLEENDRMMAALQENVVPEYFTVLPDDYKESEEYPLCIFIQGGSSSNIDLYQSIRPLDGVISVYYQSSTVKGSFARGHSAQSIRDIDALIAELEGKYSIDMDRIILGGPSAGGTVALYSAMIGNSNPSGLLLFFPALPSSVVDKKRTDGLKEKNVSIVMLCGEDDRAIKTQIHFASELLKSEVPLRMVIFPDVGHGYPENMERHTESSLRFLLGEDAN